MWVKFLYVSALVVVACCGSVPYDRSLGKGRGLYTVRQNKFLFCVSPELEFCDIVVKGQCIHVDINNMNILESTLIHNTGLESPNSHSKEKSPSPFYEIPCMSYGGLCLHKDDCPKGLEARVKGLCPMQQLQGVECCFSVPISSNTCRSRGGECWPVSVNCTDTLIFSNASDCEEDERCCILVN